MSPSPCSCAEARPTAAELNAAIRALVSRTGDKWTAEARARLHRLQAEWAAADAAEKRAAA